MIRWNIEKNCSGQKTPRWPSFPLYFYIILMGSDYLFGPMLTYKHQKDVDSESDGHGDSPEAVQLEWESFVDGTVK